MQVAGVKVIGSESPCPLRQTMPAAPSPPPSPPQELESPAMDQQRLYEEQQMALYPKFYREQKERLANK